MVSYLNDYQVQGIKVAGSSAPVSELDFCYLTLSLALGNECGQVRCLTFLYFESYDQFLALLIFFFL